MSLDTRGLVFTALLAVAIGSRDEVPKFQITTHREDDCVQVRVDKGAVIFDVRSPVGISHSLITREAEAWPKTIFLRLKLQGLEHFSLAQGDVKIEGSVSSQDGSLRLWIAEQEDKPLTEAHPLWIEVRRLDAQGQPTNALPCPDGSIELQLPRAFLKDNPSSFTLRWIDFYRN